MTQNTLWADRDLAVVWHPCTQMKDHERLPMIPVRAAEGVWLEDFDGRRYLDAISSWWVNLFGHRNTRISAAIQRQLGELEHVLLAGFTHAPVIELSEQLRSVAPAGLTRCFYADNGSSAVEVALKMSFHAHRNRGRINKTRFITLSNSYHGETLGALSVGDVELYKETYAPLLFRCITVPSPDAYLREPGMSPEQHARQMFAEMERALQTHGDEVCAVIVEPLVQCAGGMRMHDPVYLRLLRDACDHFGVHLIADEIAVGFGRTGTLFACEQAGVTPDFLCLSKGLTGGFLPLSVVMCQNETYESFYDDYVKRTAFLHSHSYTGNPLACAAALETLRIFQDEPVLERNRSLAQKIASELKVVADHKHVSDVRQTGMIAAIELVRDRKTREAFPWSERRGLRAYEYALSKGVLLRPLGNVVYFMPPYVISTEEIELMIRVAAEAIDVATR